MLLRSRRRLAILLLILGILGAGIVMWLVRESGPRLAERDPAQRVARAALLAEPGRPQTDHPATEPRWLLEPGVEGRRIAGTVIAGGRPLAGALVQLRSELFELSGRAAPHRTTDDAGRFDFGVQRPTSYAVVAGADGFRPRATTVDLRDPTTDPPADAIEIELARCESWIYGTVSDIYGGVVADGRIILASKLGRTSWFVPWHDAAIEEDGSFAICRPSSFHELVWVRAPGYGTVQLREPMPDGGWDIQLFPEGAVEGAVRDERGEPIAGARVVLIARTQNFSPPYGQTVLSEADGEFAFAGLAPGEYEVAADHGRYLANLDWPTAVVRPGETVAGLVLTMRSCRSLAGVVLGDGEPLPGVRLGPSFAAVSQTDGSFVIGCVPFEAFELVVEGFDVSDAAVPPGADDIDDLVVRVRARASISGRVVADGIAVSGAAVALGDAERDVGLLPIFGESHRARSGPDGSYRIDGVPAGTHEISAWDPATQRRSAPRSLTVSRRRAVEGVDLALARAAAVRGVVVDAEGRLVRDVRVALSGGDPARDFSDSTNDEGAFRIGGLAQARYSLCVGFCREGRPDPRYLPRDGEGWPPVIVPSDDGELELRLVLSNRSGLTISGRTRYDDGSPAPFAVVRTETREAQATSSETGAFALEGLAEATYTLRARAPDGGESAAAEVSAGATDVELVIERAGAIRGEVEGGEGACAIEARRVLHHADGRAASLPERTASATREFVFEGLTPGDYVLIATCTRGVARSEVALPPGRAVSAVLRAERGARVRGTATLYPSEEPATDIECTAGKASARTDSGGRFELEEVVPGAVRVHCQHWAGASLSAGVAPAHAETGRTAEVEVLLVSGAVPADLLSAAELDETLGAALALAPDASPAALMFRDVVADGPAARAGIEDGDLLVTVDAAAATGSRTDVARTYLQTRPAGTAVELVLERRGEERSVTVVVGGAR